MKNFFLLTASAITFTLALMFCFVITSPVKAQTLGTPCSGCPVYTTYDNNYPYNGPGGDSGGTTTLPNCGNTSGNTCSCPAGYYTNTYTAYDCGGNKGSYDCQWYNHYYCEQGSFCQNPPTSSVCSGSGYTDAYGNSCTGTEQPACVNGTPVCGGACGPTSPSISFTPACNGTNPVNNVTFSATNALTYAISRTPGSSLGNQTSPYPDSAIVQNTSYTYSLLACNATACATSVNSNTSNSLWCDSTSPAITVSVPPPVGNTCVTPTNLGANSASAIATDLGGSGVSTVTFNIYDNTTSTLVTSSGGTLVSCTDQNSAPGGGCRNGTWTNSTAFATGSMSPNDLYYTQAVAQDAAGNPPTTSNKSSFYSFDPTQCVGPFLKAPSGDVHSNQGINAPGGPQ